MAARNSYSHRGGFYTLDELVDFDELGLWSLAGVRFSRLGTLIVTAESFVNHAEAGHFVDELDNLLQVGTQDALHKLVGDGRLSRPKLAGQFLYCAADRTHLDAPTASASVPEQIRAYPGLSGHRTRTDTGWLLVAVRALRFLYLSGHASEAVALHDVIPAPKEPQSPPVVLSPHEFVRRRQPDGKSIHVSPRSHWPRR